MRLRRDARKQPGQRLGHGPHERDVILAAQAILREEPERRAEGRALSLVADLAVLELPRDERGSTLGHLKDRAAKLVPGRSPVDTLDRGECRPFRRAYVVDVRGVLLPAPCRTLDARRGEHAQIRKQPLAHFLAHEAVTRPTTTPAPGCA